jgi:hypothetical protein
MDSSSSFTATTTAVKSKPVSSRKKSSGSVDETDKISEKMEGGIIVRRYQGKKVEIER